MNRTATFVSWIAGLSAITTTGSGTLVLAKHPPDTQKDPVTITLKVHDCAHQNRSVLLAAEATATSILAQAGVNVRWTDCPILPGDLAIAPNCEPPWQANDFMINVLPNSMADLAGKSEPVLGLAGHCDMELYCWASVFYDRVSHLKGGDRAPAEVLLGRAMAHEIGHLLLGENSHSPTGIMRGHWSADDFRLEAQNDLLFTVEQSRRMKARLAERSNLLKRR